jgi:hypothetical protein
MVSRYDIHYSGELQDGADPAEVRARIQRLFKLSDDVVARLFNGQTLALKRGLDLAQAERLRQVFLEAGALARLVAQSAAAETSPLMAKGPVVAPENGAAMPRNLALAPSDGSPLEPDPDLAPPAVDISRMRLIPGQDWSLADCDRGPDPVVIPDISHLRILEPPPLADPGQGDGQRDGVAI